MRTRKRVPAVLVAIAIIATGVSTAFAGSANAAVKSSAFHLAGDTNGVTITSETDYPDGTALVNYSKNGVSFEASGPNGSTITFKPAKAGNGQSAAGSSQSIMVLSMPPTVNAAGVKVRSLGGGFGAASKDFARQHSMSLPAASPNSLGGACENLPNGYFCDNIALVADNGGGDWDISDTLSGTGSKIILIDGKISRSAPNQLIEWSPTSAVHPSSCTPYNFGFSFQGVSVSTTSSVCPDTMSPYGVSSTSFGLAWAKNCCSGATGGFAGVDVFHNPPGQSWGVSESGETAVGT